MNPIDRARILELIPHAGSMCLIDEVAMWDDASITCTATSHQATHHPLRRFGRLSCLALIEYAAQATALHGALTSGARRAGLLVAVRDFQAHEPDLTNVAGQLTITARGQLLRADATIYTFEIAGRSSQEPLAPLAHGRLSVMLSA